MNETLELQKELDPTTGAQAQMQVNFPVAIRPYNWKMSLLISPVKCITISDLGDTTTHEYDHHIKYNNTQIPLTDFISELEALIAEVKLAHGLTPIEWSFT